MKDKPLRILYVLPYVPSPIRVRPYQLIRHLAKRGHRVTVAALDDGTPAGTSLKELRSACEAVHVVPHPRLPAALSCLAALPTPTPLWAAYCRSSKMESLLRELSAGGAFDLAHVEHLRAAHFAASLGGLPRVIDAVDCITALRRQLIDQGKPGLSTALSWEEWAKLRGYEPRAYRAFRRVAVTSRHDAAALAALDPARLPPIDMIPNGVDVAYFTPDGYPAGEADCLVFSGKLSYIANEDAATFLLKEVLPRLRRRRPAAHLILAGSGPSKRLKRLASAAGGVTVTGYVDDLRPHLARARVAVCPIRIGVGVQNKALEAMAMGRPVVASPLAARALSGGEADGGLTVADGAEAVATACAALLADPAAAERAGKAARRFVEERHRWEGSAERLEAFYREALCR